MRCYNCNSQLTSLDYCSKCGADVTIYKTVVKASNSYYNMGLAKAQVRDLSGAASCLKTSLKLNKNNIKARNLLGLVYFEMGEVVEGLSQWVVSKNIKPEKNVAGIYIKKVQSNQNKLESANQCVRKYNVALRYANDKSNDLAVIQLKKIVQINPKFVKAQLLLALLLMQNKENDRAKKCLNQVLKTDKCNTLAQKYLKEIEIIEYDEEHAAGDSFIPKKKRMVTDNAPLNGNDVIMPVSHYKEPSNGAINIIYILMGVVAGAAIIYFLIMPAKLKSIQNDYNNTIANYSELMSDSNTEISSLKKQIDDLTEERDEAQRLLTSYEENDANRILYDTVIDAVNNYLQGEKTKAVEILVQIDVTSLPTSTSKNVYSMIMSECAAAAATQLYNEGYNYFRKGDYQNAVTSLEKTIKIDSSKAEAVYYCAKSYENLNETEKAKVWYQYIIDNFKNLWYANDAQAFLNRNP